MEGNGGSKRVWVWIGIIILIILIWWAIASRPVDAPADNLNVDDSSEITEENVDVVDQALDELEGLDDASLDAEFDDIDADLEEL